MWYCKKFMEDAGDMLGDTVAERAAAIERLLSRKYEPFSDWPSCPEDTGPILDED